MARPPKPATDKTVSVSLRIPRALYEEAQARAHLRRTTLTALVLEGLRLCLDTPLDPREVPVSHSNTALQELEELIDARVHAILAAERLRAPSEAPAEPTSQLPHDERIPAMQAQDAAISTQDSNAVMQAHVPPYDATKYLVGELCQNRHDFDGQGHSLRQRGGKHECVACKQARSRAHKQRQREKRAMARQN
jgi:hypothetical protein